MKAPLQLLLSLTIAFLHTSITTAPGEVPEDWKKVRSAGLKAARSDDANVRHSAFEAFKNQDHEEAAELLIKAIASSSTEIMVQKHARDVLSELGSTEVCDLVYRTLRSAPGKYFLLLEAFAKMEDSRAPEIGALALKSTRGEHDDSPIIAAAIRCLASPFEPGPEAVSAMFEYVKAGQPIGARLAALDGLERLRTAESVETLVGLFDDPALGARVRLLLVDVAGRDIGSEKEKWVEWWATQAGKVPEGEPLSQEAAQVMVDASAQAAEEDGSAASFYGVPIEGEHVLFVLDASSSMTGYPLDRLKDECTKLVQELPETHHFALLFFPGNSCYPKEMLAASEEVKEKAYKFIAKRKVERGTPVTKAMEYGYRRFVEKYGKVDAIYLLSDGAPTNPISKVLAKIDDLNAGLYIPIHTIYIGVIPEQLPGQPGIEDVGPPVGPIRTGWGFLKEVARRHDGKFSVSEL